MDRKVNTGNNIPYHFGLDSVLARQYRSTCSIILARSSVGWDSDADINLKSVRT